VNVAGLGGDDTFDIVAATATSLDGGEGNGDQANYLTPVLLDVIANPLSNIERINAGVPGATLLGANKYELLSSTTVQVNDDTAITYSNFDNLVGTAGDDTFDLAGFVFSGLIDGLDANLGDQVVISQNGDSATNIGFLAGDGDGYISFGVSSESFQSAGLELFQLQYAGIEDFVLNLGQDLNIKGQGVLGSSQDINVGGSLTMYGPSQSAVPLTLIAQRDINVGENLILNDNADIDVSGSGAVLTIGQAVVVDTAGGAQIDGFISVNITEEPVLQLQVEETTSLSVFDEIDIFSAGRSSVARRDDGEIESEGDLIEILSN
jgi:hypothetical protein